ncbi:angiopoietin-related protein 6-like [Argopecten irradians]|uniref:angiopoietin-related protein 6-like n=1 Tax=Argopecten irradians TaxID=31199 RepID=UPI0037149FF6
MSRMAIHCYVLVCMAIAVQGVSFYAILKGVANATSLLGQTTDVEKLSKCAKLCENEDCASFSFNQQQTTCRLYSSRHIPSLDSPNDGYSYFQKREEGEFTNYTRLAQRFFFEDREWTVIQKRFDGSISMDRLWNEYKNGFGDTSGEYWIGLETMHQVTTNNPTSLLVLLESWAGVMKYALYETFTIASEHEKYRIDVSGYSGTAGDCLDTTGHNHMKFSTRDNDNDLTHNSCAKVFKSGYWYAGCSACNINGPMKNDTGKNERYAIVWHTFRNHFTPLRKSMMMMSNSP